MAHPQALTPQHAAHLVALQIVAKLALDGAAIPAHMVESGQAAVDAFADIDGVALVDAFTFWGA